MTSRTKAASHQYAPRVPEVRVRAAAKGAIRQDGDYVLYWMIACRRLHWNFGLQRAAEWAKELKKPLVIFEPLRVDYPWASDRLHRFVLDGMRDNRAEIARHDRAGIVYYPHVEPARHADRGLLAASAERACVVVTDDFPCFFLPRMVAAASRRVQIEQVDSNGLLPLRATDRVFTTAASFRRYLQKELPNLLTAFPLRDPLASLKLPPLAAPPRAVLRRWPAATERDLARESRFEATLPIDHSVGAVDYLGGAGAARKRLKRFLSRHVADYAAGANQVEEDTRSGLSPYLHFGHISPHELFVELMAHEGWSPAELAEKASGQREAWWGASPGAESWLDEFITWRELGYNLCSHRDDYDRYESLPDWARATLEKHARDSRRYAYSLEEFAAAETHDPLWNAAQRQLIREGRIHNYLRMLWGKKILEWSDTPRTALAVMIELNNRYAVDGRDPNSYSGIFWCLGRYDRPWGPERPIFGTVRYMSSDNTRRKMNVAEYLRAYGA